MHVSRLAPPFRGLKPHQVADLCGRTLLPLDVAGDRQFLLGIRQGLIHDKAALLRLLDGRVLAELETRAEAQPAV